MCVSCKMLRVLFVLFFFFQAEDGIRDYKVTGVQTCALPIYAHARAHHAHHGGQVLHFQQGVEDRKSTRLNSSHLVISYAVFCLKKKKSGAGRWLWSPPSVKPGGPRGVPPCRIRTRGLLVPAAL